MIGFVLGRMPQRLPGDAVVLPGGVRPDVEACLGSGTLLLERAGVETARLDAECLLAHVLSCPRWQVVLKPQRRLTREEFGRFLMLLERRERREPLAYLLGTREFWSMPLQISPGVLIPRPETETLVEAALAVLPRMDPRPPTGSPSEGVRRPRLHPGYPADRPPLVVDLGTGSGAVAIALARELPETRIVATDISRRALRVARMNAEAQGVSDRILFLRGDLWRALHDLRLGGQVDLVVSNPPYIPSGTLGSLMPEVQWEPRLALDGGPDGLRVIREIIAITPERLRPGGFLLLEIGDDQATAVTRLVREVGGFEEPQVRLDLAGRDRVVVARLRGNSK